MTVDDTIEGQAEDTTQGAEDTLPSETEAGEGVNTPDAQEAQPDAPISPQEQLRVDALALIISARRLGVDIHWLINQILEEIKD